MDISYTYIEKEILRQVASGDEAAFVNLFNAWKDKLYFYILRITGSRENTDDIVQEVFVKLWLKREILNDVDHFSAYLYRMAHNYAISGIRRMAQETVIFSELYRHKNEVDLPADEHLLHKQLQEKLKGAINALPQQQKLVYILGREQGLKQEDIARRLNISISTVKNHMTQALRTLREELRNNYSTLTISILIAIIMLLTQ
ncbi:MAG: RNA polymerase sigma-70 factor [Chitinophagaceae bacterium]|nr:RNA polymerase sigma-70 factor [Chitinophagaceae bacterium]